jgi:maleylpyruvate isomerase
MSAMDTDFPNLDETVVATARLLGAVSELGDEDVHAPSLLPGWTRAHVITHLARNADALSNLLHGAQRGEVGTMYDSQERRDADIEAGSKRSAAELRADLVAACGRWVQAANELHAGNLDNPGARVPGGEQFPVRRVGMMRRTEVEVHHADLGAGYTAADWPADFVSALFKRRQRELKADGIGLSWRSTDTGERWSSGEGPEVSGPAGELVWWLLGRGSGASLACSGGELPVLGRWA